MAMSDEPGKVQTPQKGAERMDVLLMPQLAKLTDISARDEPEPPTGIKKRYSAHLYDMVKDHNVKVQTESKEGFDTFLVQEEG